jgi:hypothetical protein
VRKIKQDAEEHQYKNSIHSKQRPTEKHYLQNRTRIRNINDVEYNLNLITATKYVWGKLNEILKQGIGNINMIPDNIFGTDPGRTK